MKYFYILILLFCFSFYLNGEKIALIIAIGEYPKDSGWNNISSHNDVIHLSNAFRAIGIKPNNINILSDQAATKKGIINAFEKLSKQSNIGDHIFIHFSGHGQQVFDINGDEIDLLDEAIVPYDSPKQYQTGIYQGENLIRDDELSDILYALRLKLGKNGSLVLTLDSCHSGTATRATERTRGTTVIMAPPTFKKSEYFIPEKNIGLKSHEQENLAPMVNLFGSSCQQLNYETTDENNQPVGSFSYSLSKNLREAKNNFSYKELFDRVRLQMKQIAPWQDPSYEGNIDMPIFEKTTKNNENLFEVLNIYQNKTAKLSCGQLQNVFKGDEIIFFNSNGSETINKGTVTESSLLSSKVLLKNISPANNHNLIKAKVHKRNNKNETITILNDLSPDNTWFEKFNNLLKADYISQINYNPDFIITNDSKENSFCIKTTTGDIVFQSSSKAEIAEFNKSLALINFQKNEHKSNLNIEFQVFDCDKTSEFRIFKEGETLKVGDCVKFKITNNGIKTRYFTLFNITPQNNLIEIIPTREFGYTPQEYFLKQNESFTSNFHIEIKESGNNIFKLITSKRVLNFFDFLARKPEKSDSEFDLEMLLINLKEQINRKNNGTKDTNNQNVNNIESLSLEFEVIN